MKNRTIKAVCAVAALSGLATAPLTTAVAEEVRVPVMSQAERGAQENLPRTGMSQSGVRNGWGNPIRTSGPVGNPPISQWHYADFVVYFEADRVIHAVKLRLQLCEDKEVVRRGTTLFALPQYAAQGSALMMSAPSSAAIRASVVTRCGLPSPT